MNEKKQVLGSVFAAPRDDDRVVAVRLDPEQGYLTTIPRRDAPITFNLYAGPTRKELAELGGDQLRAERHHMVVRKSGTHPVADRHWKTASGATQEYIPGKHKRLKSMEINGEAAQLVFNDDISCPAEVRDLLAAADTAAPCLTDALLPTYWAVVTLTDATSERLAGYGFGPYLQRVQYALIEKNLAAVPYPLAADWGLEIVSEFVTTTLNPRTLKAEMAVGWIPAAFESPQPYCGWELSIGAVGVQPRRRRKKGFGVGRIRI